MEYIICKDKTKFIGIGDYNYCNLEDMILPEIIAIDSETSGLEARKNDIFCIQIGTGTHSYLIKMYDNEYTFYDLIPYIEDKILVLHNSLFDIGFFYKYNFIPDRIEDTMLASKILYNGDVENVRNDFGAVMYRELGIKYDKTEQKNISQVKLSTPSSIAYCFQDVAKLVELHYALQEKIIAGGYKETYKLHCKYIKALAYIEQCGLAISSKKWKAKMEEDVINASKWKQHIEEYIYEHIPIYREKQLSLFDVDKRITCSVTSPTQMVKVFQTLGIETKDKDGKDSINENIISKSKHEFVELWLNFQEANHRVTTFGSKIYDQIENERIYTNFNPMVDTARLSTRKGNINFLNFPADSVTRDCFEANEGNVMVVCDYGMQEGVILSDVSQDEAMMASVLEGVDLHCLLTKKIFKETENLSDDEIKEFHKEKRQQSKVSRFAMSYGANAYTLHVNQNIPMEEAVKIEVAFKELHKGIYEWGNGVYQNSIKTGYIESVDGWKLKLPEYKKFIGLKNHIEAISKEQWQSYRQGKFEYKSLKEDKEYKVKFPRDLEYYREKRKQVSDFFKLKSEYQRLTLNNPIQSEGSHMTKRAVLFFFNWIVENDLMWRVKICNVPHDELDVECEENLKDLVKENLEKCMIAGGDYYLKTIKIKADANYGKSWYTAK